MTTSAPAGPTLRHPAVWRQLSQLGWTARLDAEAPTPMLRVNGPPGSLPPDLAAMLREHRDELLADLAMQAAVAAGITDSIDRARSFAELEVASDTAEMAFGRGLVTADQVVALTRMAIASSQEMVRSGVADQPPVSARAKRRGRTEVNKLGMFQVSGAARADQELRRIEGEERAQELAAAAVASEQAGETSRAPAVQPRGIVQSGSGQTFAVYTQADLAQLNGVEPERLRSIRAKPPDRSPAPDDGVWASDLVGPPGGKVPHPDVCRVCGKDTWAVDKYGVWHCSTCHPLTAPPSARWERTNEGTAAVLHDWTG